MISRISRRNYLLLLFLAGVSLGVYLAASRLMEGWGFPLDDAWIHQTYARNLAWLGQWAFIPGVPSAGSTSPLWSALLSPGYLLHLGPFAWTFILEWLLLAALSILGENAYRAYFDRDDTGIPWVGILLVFEWHLVWASGSGMEVLLLSLIIAGVLFALNSSQPRWFLLGLIVGATVWIRPDGLTLMGPVLMAIILSQAGVRQKLQHSVEAAGGFAVIFLPYLLFNRLLSGSIWPNTFYAKQAEYGVYQQIPLLIRYLNEIKLPLIGVGAILLPGFIAYAWAAARRMDWPRIAGILWLLGYIGLYAWRLPVEYQHGRYIMPAMPVYFVWAATGMAWLLKTMWQRVGWRWVVSRAWLVSTALVLAGFWLIGARTYAGDVAIINTEMVRTAEWIAANTPQDALIAAHDIGALGFYGQRNILDLAGLISPEVIPFIRDESRLATYLDQKQAGYLMTFPSWYPKLVSGRQLLYSSGGEFALQSGNDNMAVFQWQK